MDFVQVGKGIVEITLMDGTVINFENPYPIGAKPINKNQLWIFWPENITPLPDYFLEEHKRFYMWFNGDYPDEAYMADVDDCCMELVGEVKSEVYISDKEGDFNQQYIHHHKKPRPKLYVNRNEDLFIIKGGKFKIMKKPNYPLAWFFD